MTNIKAEMETSWQRQKNGHLQNTLDALVGLCDAFDNEDDDLLQAYQESVIFSQHNLEEIVSDFAALKDRYEELKDRTNPQ